ncbi:MAG: hypothetical protein C0487_12175 [Leptothrix sp. (in: Bacteria)]|nr:hypothetical protein [Leptothrix sp. (in: b-proteobacteria)]
MSDEALDHTDLLNAFSALLAPMARLAVSQGLPFPAVEALLKRSFVDAARQALVEAGLPEHRLVSRISTSTGIYRREVSRLTQANPTEEAARPASRSLASEVLAQWLTDPQYRAASGGFSPLRRQGPAPSFESLARSVTQDVHPRSVLEELCRLGMAEVDGEEDSVRLLRASFVPRGDQAQMLSFLADNLGDHLSGAVHNVMGNQAPRQHFDQAVFADELSQESLEVVRTFVSGQWQRLLNEAVPLLEQRLADDQAAARRRDRRVRIGLYSYDDLMREHHDD